MSGLASLAAQTVADRDLDGVPDVRDSCPKRPNAPDASGAQPLVCGKGLSEALQHYVFLVSRTFLPPEGVDPALIEQGRQGERRVLLHIRRDDDRLVLSPAQRERLRVAGVRLGRYLPSHTYFAVVPAGRAALERIAALPFVRGISAIRPEDRIGREVRRERGALVARQSDGSMMLAVELYEDVDEAAVAGLFDRPGIEQVVADGEERHVRVRSFATVLDLARSDRVAWIDAVPEGLQRHDDAARAETWTDVVERVEGYDGTDIRVAMFEQSPLPLPPDQHPDLTERVIRDNCNGPIELCPPEDQLHNLAVAGIMIGDGTLDPTKRGLLPGSILSIFGDAWPHTDRHIWFRYPTRARDDHEAVLINYSLGSQLNCNRIGEYRSDAKQLDKAVVESGIAIVRAVGNTRGSTGFLATDPSDPDAEVAAEAPKHGPCQADLESLPGPVAKNDIAVGNWDLNTGAVNVASAAGPTEDERLKPDLVAPGDGLTAPSLDGSAYGYDLFAGTSAAAPVVSGVLGQVYQAFRDGPVPREPLDVPAATVKAILIHTARDVGPWGPDYYTGWGRVDAAAAVRVALDHGSYIYEGKLTSTQIVETHNFDVTGTVYGFKVTLVWDDPKAASGASHALVNDLDLIVTDATGAQSFFPLDTLLRTAFRRQEALEGAKRCTSIFCRDDRNNVEQAIVSDPAGAPLPTGTWAATVIGNPLAEPDQPFTLVVTPDECPVRIFEDTALAGPVECPYEPLEVAAISIEADDVELDCDGHAVRGAGANVDGFEGIYTGIRTGHDRVAVRNCTVEDFDVGIDFAGNEAGEVADSDVQRVGTAGVRMSGDDHTVLRTTVSQVRKSGGDGIHMTGQGHAVLSSEISANPGGPQVAAGINFLGTGGLSRIENNIVTYATTGILINSTDAEDPLDGLVASGNSMGPVSRDGIRITGPLRNSTIINNTIEGFGEAHAAIRLRAKTQEGSGPTGNVVAFNRIYGYGVSTQKGIFLEGQIWTDPADPAIQLEARPTGNQVFGHLVVQSVGIGVSEVRGQDNEIFGNILPATSVGIETSTSSGNPNGRHVFGNIIAGAPTGISVTGRTQGFVGANIITEAGTGILVNLVSEFPVRIGPGNFIRVVQGGVGIVVGSSDAVTVQGNNVGSAASALGPGAGGISASTTTGLTVVGNVIHDLPAGITIAATPDAGVSGNTITNADTVGIAVSSSSGVQITGNTLESAPAVPPIGIDAGILYASGDDGRIEGNVLSPSTPGTYGVVLGTLGPKPVGTSSGVTISAQEIENFATAVAIGSGVTSFALADSSLEASDRALDGQNATALVSGEVKVTGSVLNGTNKDAYFVTPIDTSGNTWSEVPAMDVLDGDGDGDGDCGADYLFSSTDYTGPRPGVALTSTKTNQISDDAPLNAQPGACP